MKKFFTILALMIATVVGSAYADSVTYKDCAKLSDLDSFETKTAYFANWEVVVTEIENDTCTFVAKGAYMPNDCAFDIVMHGVKATKNNDGSISYAFNDSIKTVYYDKDYSTKGTVVYYPQKMKMTADSYDGKLHMELGYKCFLNPYTYTFNYTEDNWTLDEGKDNAASIAAEKNARVNAILTRSLVGGKWNTFCVPFNVDDLSEYDGLLVKEYDSEKGVSGSTMYFKTATAIEAGKPYLVKPTADIVNPVFKKVVITATEPQSVGTDDYKFVGVFSPYTFTAQTMDASLFLQADGTLAYPQSDTTMKGLRAYFSLTKPTADAVSARVVIEGEETAISEIVTDDNASDGSIYTLNGVYVGKNVSNLAKGIYIKNGKKIVLK
jgi:hypothetical protein